MSTPDLDYVPGSCVGELKADRLEEYAKDFAEYYELKPVALPSSLTLFSNTRRKAALHRAFPELPE